MKLPGQESPKLFWVVPFLIGFIVGGLVFTAVVLWITTDMPVTPGSVTDTPAELFCQGDKENIDGQCVCKAGYMAIGNECQQQLESDKVPDPCSIPGATDPRCGADTDELIVMPDDRFADVPGKFCKDYPNHPTCE